MTPDGALEIVNRAKAALAVTDSGMIWQALWAEIAAYAAARVAAETERCVRLAQDWSDMRRPLSELPDAIRARKALTVKP